MMKIRTVGTLSTTNGGTIMLRKKPVITILIACLSMMLALFMVQTSAQEIGNADKGASITEQGFQMDPAVQNEETALLPAPQITGFDSLDEGVKITWAEVPGAAKYRVYYKGRNGWTSMDDTADTSFIDTDVGSGHTYTYSVQCVSEDGSQVTSEMDTTGRQYTYNMATPQITSLVSTDKGVRITWEKVPNASRYRVYYYGSRGWTRMTETTDTSYLDMDVAFGYRYTYTVRCVNENGRFTSDFNSTGWKHKHYLVKPRINELSTASNGVSIKWNKVDYAAKYRVYYKNRSGNWVRMVETSGTSYVDSDVAYGYTYTYTVRCVSADGKAFTSDFDTNGWQYTYYYDDPEITSLSSTGKGVVIAWDPIGAAKYCVYYYGSKGWTRMGETTGTSFTDTDVRIGVTYRYTVRAITSDGSRFTSGFNGAGWRYKYDPKLSAPVITKCETINNGVRIYWEPVSSVNKYKVYYKNRNNNWVEMGETTGTSFVDDVVKGGSTYTYAVRCLAAKSGDFASGYSTETSHTYVDAPQITKLESAAGGVRITWNAPAGATRYRVYYKNSNGGWTKMAEATENTYLDTDVSNGGNYTYTVRCVNVNGWFTSWFHTSGWRYAFNDWSTLYRDYVSNKTYLSYVPSAFKSDTHYYSVYDLDDDGVPELIINVGYAAANNHHVIFTAKNGKVSYLMFKGLFGSIGAYAPDSEFRGVFTTAAHTGYAAYHYHYIKNGEWHTELVMDLLEDSSSASHVEYKMKSKTSNSSLYNAFINATYVKDSSSGSFRSFKYSIKTYTYEEVRSGGWQ